MHWIRTSFLALAALSLGACAPTAALSERVAKLPKAALGSVRDIGHWIDNGFKTERRNPTEALGSFITALHESEAKLRTNPNDPAAITAYNFALGRVFSVVRSSDLNPWGNPMPAGPWVLDTATNGRKWKLQEFEFIPVDELEIKGTYFKNRATRAGIGAPLVAISRQPPRNSKDNFLPAGRLHYGVTATALFKGNRCEITFHDPLDADYTTVAGTRYPLAADYSAPIAVLLAREKVEKLGLARLINPEKFADTARLARLRPYDSSRTPLLLVHGLMDTPATWVPLFNALRSDPVLRKKYQIWSFSYPTGYPYPYSAALLRRELERIRKMHPDHKRIVIVGHSMGGIISRLMLTCSEDALWKVYFKMPPEKLKMSAADREILQSILMFDECPNIGRAIFIAAPHRGAEMASSWIGRLGSRLVRIPKTFLKLTDSIKDALLFDQADATIARFPTSVDTLSPQNRFVLEVNKLPLAKNIPYHSIIGDRGRGDTPKSSDGFVPYWSSHLEGARSELIVPSNHSVHQNPQAIEEVRRILHLHLKGGR